MKIDLSKISGATLARGAVMILAFVNQILSVTGHPVLPIDESELEMLVSTGFTIVTALISYWYDNDITEKAISRKAAGEKALAEKTKEE